MKMLKKVLLLISILSISFCSLFLIAMTSIDMGLLLKTIPCFEKYDLEYIPDAIFQNKVNVYDDTENVSNLNQSTKEMSYYYQHLSKEMKENYDVLYLGILNEESNIEFPHAITEKECLELAHIIKLDTPEMFQITSDINYFTEFNSVVSYQPSYQIHKETYLQYLKAAEQVKEKVVKKTASLSNFEKVKYIHEYIINNTEYSNERDNCKNIYGCLILGYANCEGYAAAFNYLCRAVGIDSSTVIGETINSQLPGDDGHAWNMVKLEDYYYLDVGWDDIKNEQPDFPLDCTYSYFLLNYEDMLKTRTINSQLENLGKIPETTDSRYSYYKDKGLFANTIEDAERIIKKRVSKDINDTGAFILQCEENILLQTEELLTTSIKNAMKENSIPSNTYNCIKIEKNNLLIIY